MTNKNFVISFNQNSDFEAAPKGFEAGNGTLIHCLKIAVDNGFTLDIEVDEDSIRLFNEEGDWALIEAE
jgi:hypothetical protein